MDDHLGNPHIHLARLRNVRTVEVDQLALQDLLCPVDPCVVPDLDHPVVDLPHVDLVRHLVGGLAAGAALLEFVVVELLAMGGCVEDVEDVSEHGGAWEFNPVQIGAGVQQPVVSCLGLVTSSIGCQFLHILNGLLSIGEILVLEEAGVSVVSVGNYCEPEGDSLGAHLVLDALDDGLDGGLHLRQLVCH